MNKKSAAVMNWRNRTKLRLIEYKGGKCCRCGFGKPIPAIYDFHHRDPSTKDFRVSSNSWGFDKIKDEVDKCDLLCKNCHAELHWELNQSQRHARLLGLRRIYPVQSKVCERCGAMFKPDKTFSKFCSRQCYNFASRKVDRPSKEALASELEQLNWRAIGRKYGVTDNAVRKWARQYGLL